jgi:hypothetical protein
METQSKACQTLHKRSKNKLYFSFNFDILLIINLLAKQQTFHKRFTNGSSKESD